MNEMTNKLSLMSREHAAVFEDVEKQVKAGQSERAQLLVYYQQAGARAR